MNPRRYCKSAELGDDWQQALKNVDRAEAMDFLEYLCQ